MKIKHEMGGLPGRYRMSSQNFLRVGSSGPISDSNGFPTPLGLSFLRRETCLYDLALPAL